MAQLSQIVEAGEELTGFNQRRFRSLVEAAAETSYVVVADFSRTRRIDRWGFLTLFDLHERLKPRLVVVAPEHVRRAMRRLDPRGALPVFESLDAVHSLVEA